MKHVSLTTALLGLLLLMPAAPSWALTCADRSPDRGSCQSCCSTEWDEDTEQCEASHTRDVETQGLSLQDIVEFSLCGLFNPPLCLAKWVGEQAIEDFVNDRRAMGNWKDCIQQAQSDLMACSTQCSGMADSDSCEDELMCSPVLFDLDRGGFRLTSREEGVFFDIDVDGSPERVAWTVPGSGDGWLVLDRNRNGRIDSGRELFGELTPQPVSGQPNGYEALIRYDSADYRGNEDGLITGADEVFADLQIWVDANHDGISQPLELSSLAEHGIVVIDLRYHSSSRRDPQGNEFRYKSKARTDQGTVQTYDVYLRTGPED